MKKVKIWTILLLAFVLTAGFTACGGDGLPKPTATPEPTATQEPADTTAPVITMQQGAQETYTTAVDTDLILPSATASDNKDGDISASLDVSPTNQIGVIFTQNSDKTYTFRASVAGEHKISYYAEDAAGNNDEKFVTVNVTPVNAETSVPEEDNDISNLETSEKTFIENFASGYNSDLAKGLVFGGTALKASISGGGDALAGNSLILDYTDCLYNTNTSFFFGALDGYIKPGRWTIEFDVKKLSGNIPDFYVSFVFDGDNTGGDNVPYVIGSETAHITYNYIKNFDITKTWHFRVFTYTGNSGFVYDGLKLAFDNFKFTWKEVVDATVQRTTGEKTLTAAELDAGYTLDGTDGNYSKLGGNGGASWMQIDKLVAGDVLTAEQAANLTAANGFNSPYAMRLTTQINSFESLKNLFIDPGYDYTITLKVYAPAASSGWYFFITNGSGAQAYANGLNAAGEGDAGAKTWTRTVLGNESYANIGLYTGGNAEIYIGDITVSRAVHTVAATTPKGYTVGKTWTLSDITPLSGNSTKVNTAEVTLSDSTLLSSKEGFGATAVLFEDANAAADKNAELFRGGDYFEAGCTYEISFVLYFENLSGGPLMVNFDGAAFKNVTDAGASGLVTSTITNTGAIDFFCLYTQGATQAKVYVGSVTIKLTAIA